MNIRHLTSEDVPGAMDLSRAAGWNQTPEDWARMIALEPRGCFCVQCDGRIVATATLLCFGTDLAWIGMVLTHADYKRRGFARALMCAALDESRARGVRTVKLDATDQGYPLYAALGFVDEQPIERWRCDYPNMAEDLTPARVWDRVLDREAFGADRWRFVESLGPAFGDESGYVMTREGTRAQYLGPCVARDAAGAARLVRSVLKPGAWFWDLLPNHVAALSLAVSLGFQPVRHLVRMRLGPPIETRDDLVYAIAGFEAG